MSGASGLQAGNLFVKKLVLGRGRGGLSFSVSCATFAGAREWPPRPAPYSPAPGEKAQTAGETVTVSALLSLETVVQ